MSRSIQQLIASGGTAACVIIVDASGSMMGQPYERLRKSLDWAWDGSRCKILAFNWIVEWCDSPDDLPAPDGGTNLAMALHEAAKLAPGEVIVISDGCPDDPEAAIQAADMIPGTISTFYCGDDGRTRGVEFLRRLARIGGGVFEQKDIRKHLSIETEIRGMLGCDKTIAL